jgi:hypothetical protein
MLYQNPAIRSRVEVYLVEEAKGGPSKLLLSFLFRLHVIIAFEKWELTVGSPWRQGRLYGSTDATFVQFGLRERIPRINGPTAHLRCPHVTAIRFLLSGSVLAGSKIYVNSNSQFHSRSHYDSTPQKASQMIISL